LRLFPRRGTDTKVRLRGLSEMSEAREWDGARHGLQVAPSAAASKDGTGVSSEIRLIFGAAS